jgi:hypothetical protein
MCGDRATLPSLRCWLALVPVLASTKRPCVLILPLKPQEPSVILGSCSFKPLL